MDDETLFGWVHLSDIHVGHGGAGYAPNQKLVLDQLKRDVAANHPKARVDAILVTGDIAFSGAKDQYDHARTWLLDVAKTVGLDASAVFTVPGNHDVNRKADEDPGIGPLVEMLRAGGRSLDADLANAKAKKALAERMSAYLDFAAGFGPWAGRASTPAPEDRLTWTSSPPARGGLRVRLVGLNTALLCKNGDKGKLQLGEKQLVDTLLPSAEPGEIIIALSHHPFRTGWLADEDNARQWLARHGRVHLSGHVHEAATEYAGNARGEGFVYVVAGAAHGDRLPERWMPAQHGYSFGEVRRGDDGKLVLRIHPRLWSERNKVFVRDVNGVPERQDHAEHPLGETLPARPATAPSPAAPSVVAFTAATPPPAPIERPSPTLPAAGAPVRVLIVHAPEDAAAKRELEKALAGARRANEITLRASMEDADVILLVLTRDMIANDHCYEVDMEAARARHEAGSALVMAVLPTAMDLVKEADFKRVASGERKVLWYEKLRRLPYAAKRDQNERPIHVAKDGIPIASWSNADEAWTEIARELRDEIEALRRRN